MNAILQKTVGHFIGWFGDGPWRSKSVLAAVAVVVVGLGVWCSSLKSSLPQSETNSATANASGIMPPNAAGTPAGSHWNWSKSFPFYVPVGVSYAAGFCLGWFFRKLTRLILVVGALVIALLAYGKLAGCDMTHAQEEVKRGDEWAQHEVTTGEGYLKHVLPSAAGGGAGIFLGFRRRNKAVPTNPAA